MYNETVAFWTYAFAMDDQTRTEQHHKANADKQGKFEANVV